LGLPLEVPAMGKAHQSLMSTSATRRSALLAFRKFMGEA
jgi:hypothetical protein